MASRRMLAAGISVSEQVAALTDDFARLLFTWMIAHADDWGVMSGAPAKVRALVVPMLDVTVEQVAAALADMDAQGLIWRYTWTDGTPYVQFRGWETHQSGLHKRTAPKAPRYRDLPENSADGSPSPSSVPGSSGKFREVPPRSGTEVEQKRSEENSHARMVTQAPREDSGKLTSRERERAENHRPAQSQQRPNPRTIPLAADVAELIEPCPRLSSGAAEWERMVCELRDAGYGREQLLEGVTRYKREMSQGIPLTLRAFCRHAQRLIGDDGAGGAAARSVGAAASVVELDRRRDDARRARRDAAAAEHQRLAREAAAALRARDAVPGGPSG